MRRLLDCERLETYAEVRAAKAPCHVLALRRLTFVFAQTAEYDDDFSGDELGTLDSREGS